MMKFRVNSFNFLGLIFRLALKNQQLSPESAKNQTDQTLKNSIIEMKYQIDIIQSNYHGIAEDVHILEKEMNEIEININGIRNDQNNNNQSNIKIIQLPDIDNQDNASNILSLPNSKSNISDIETKTKLDIFDILAQDYVDCTVVPESYQQFATLAQVSTPIDEKFKAFFYMIRHYKLIPIKVLRGSIGKLKESLYFSRDNPK